MLQALQRYTHRNMITEPDDRGTRTERLHRPQDAAARSLHLFHGRLVILLLLCLLLVGCGSNSSGVGGQSQNTPTTPALTPSPTHGQQAQNCGVIDTSLQGKALDAPKAKTASNCFQQAYQHCQAATLTVNVHSLDTGAKHVFTTNNINGKCAITDTVTHYIAPNNLKTTRSYTCSGLTMQADGLHFIDCGGLGTIVVPI